MIHFWVVTSWLTGRQNQFYAAIFIFDSDEAISITSDERVRLWQRQHGRFYLMSFVPQFHNISLPLSRDGQWLKFTAKRQFVFWLHSSSSPVILPSWFQPMIAVMLRTLVLDSSSNLIKNTVSSVLFDGGMSLPADVRRSGLQFVTALLKGQA